MGWIGSTQVYLFDYSHLPSRLCKKETMGWSRFWYYFSYKLLFSWWSHIIQDHARLCQICANDSYSRLKIQWVFSWNELVINISIVLVAMSHSLWLKNRSMLPVWLSSNMKNYCNRKILWICWKKCMMDLKSFTQVWLIYFSCNPK